MQSGIRVWGLMGAALIMGPAWAGPKETTKAEVGKPAPAFALKDLAGKEYNLSDYRGKVVVLEWTNHSCPIVNSAYTSKAMPKTIEKFKNKDVVWLAIDSSHFCVDRAAEIRTWAQQQGIRHPILLDAPGVVGKKYGARTTPHMFVIDRKGVLAYQGALDDDPYRTGDGSRNYVAEAVTALLDGSTVATKSVKPYGCSVKYKRE